ncbi:MarR family winged helix-turn-helix transcriptional regulator [Brevibacillus migulae]|uniref:MarR family winged helix-turn-helix transcriptional regulator n=1 Tax=Brevibacillus migulae TaxID=1644114 RepID=UPI00106E9023|nr:MarR family transcriptional regulator [Brevibacillus migulae]
MMQKETSFQDMFLDFFEIYRIVHATVASHLQRYGLNEKTLSILLMLTRQKTGMAPSRLAKGLNLTKGAVSTMVESLAHAGFVERQPNRFDRRTVTIQLTEKGRSYISTILSSVPKLRAEILSQLKPEQQRGLLEKSILGIQNP